MRERKAVNGIGVKGWGSCCRSMFPLPSTFLSLSLSPCLCFSLFLVPLFLSPSFAFCSVHGTQFSLIQGRSIASLKASGCSSYTPKCISYWQTVRDWFFAGTLLFMHSRTIHRHPWCTYSSTESRIEEDVWWPAKLLTFSPAIFSFFCCEIYDHTKRPEASIMVADSVRKIIAIHYIARLRTIGVLSIIS